MVSRPKYMAVQGAGVIVGVAFLAIGALGFIPAVTSNYDQLDWAGHHSGAKLFGVFAVSGLHNILHLAFGALGLLFARTYAAARAYLLLGGLAYLGLWAYGLLIDHASSANIVPVSAANNWLHLGMGGVLLLLGVTLGAQHDPTKLRPRRRLHRSPQQPKSTASKQV
jgi:uncharacterized protein DUF4383